ncbi:class I SAM-dependent methyltransferase [Geobacter sp. AOG1]|uniref:class I SAM-dependent methyltransferase n=1 Tax=Geobacter sp. AOG1 TaxID=1566346 RepID=UPI001CC3445F|nr:class I SAM-dependent methyltransferase [Geobacter sp. AOG1]GFE57772.1 hypothetical protein AOG1_16520 [Geobacter sp. AOG1]
MTLCSVCGNSIENFIDGLFDDRYAYPGYFTLVRCLACGHKQLLAEFDHEALLQLYTEFYPRSTYDLANYNPHGEVHGLKPWLVGEYCAAFRWVPRNVRVLDIGCGFGETLGYHRARGCDVYGVEADENIRRVAEKYQYKVHVGLFDSTLYEPGFFDYVTMDHVIEHVTNPLETMKSIAAILKTNGTVILSTPNANGWGARLFGRRWINWHTPYHLHFFSTRSMAIAAEKAGLVLEQSKTITSSEWLHFQWCHLLSFPDMGQPSSFWLPSSGTRFETTKKYLLVKLIRRTKLNHVITRFFDLCGCGDNRLFFLRKTEVSHDVC